jgi:hypothetical protein
MYFTHHMLALLLDRTAVVMCVMHHTSTWIWCSSCILSSCICCCRGKRRLTNDFASIVYRIKLLGFNAIRVQFKFSDLNVDLPTGGDPEFFPCLVSIEQQKAPWHAAVLGNKVCMVVDWTAVQQQPESSVFDYSASWSYPFVEQKLLSISHCCLLASCALM